MFLPIDDCEPNRYEHYASMTVLLITVNSFIWLGELVIQLGSYADLYRLFLTYGFMPVRVLNDYGGGAVTAITSTFLHGNFLHLFGNMVFLWVFGRRVEDACGPWRFLAFYLTCGAAASLATYLSNPEMQIPGIGASGAISGVLGAHLLLFPGGRIRTLLLLVYIPIWVRVRVYWFMFVWLAMQIPPALLVLFGRADYSTGYWAHLGGFLTAPLILLFLRPRAFQRFLSGLPM